MHSIFYQRRQSSFDGIIETFIHEGLISSYNLPKLQKHLKGKFGSRIEIINPTSEDFQNSNFDWKAYSFIINSQKMDEILQMEIQTLLNLYGYYIAKKIITNDKSSFLIEPRYPIIINDYLQEQNINDFYHITHKSNWNNIKKIGLAPRASETTFYHPDDRIYLIFAQDKTKIMNFRNVLAKNKGKDKNDFLILKTSFNANYQYYLDDTTTSKKYNIIACFVLKNIPPSALTLVG